MTKWLNGGNAEHQGVSTPIHIMGSLHHLLVPPCLTLSCFALVIPRVLVSWLPGRAGRVRCWKKTRGQKKWRQGMSPCQSQQVLLAPSQALALSLPRLHFFELLSGPSPQHGPNYCGGPQLLNAGNRTSSQPWVLTVFIYLALASLFSLMRVNFRY